MTTRIHSVRVLLLTTAFLAVLGGVSSHAEAFLPEIERGASGSKRVAITFDGGSSIGATNSILDILREKRVRCTIFLTGTFIRRHPEMVLRMVHDGHEIGNHTYSHPHLTTWEQNRTHRTLPRISHAVLHSELLRTENEFYRLTGRSLSRFWRAPFGERNAQIVKWASELGYVHVFWTSDWRGSLDTLDWVNDPRSRLYRTSEEIKRLILTYPELDGAIILMHLGSDRPHDPVHEKLPEIIDELRSRGYECVTISGLLGGR